MPPRDRGPGRWVEHAACRGEDLDLFFGFDGERKHERELREEKARMVCAPCPVRTRCLHYAVAANEPDGVWGGLSREQRHADSQRRAAVKLTCEAMLAHDCDLALDENGWVVPCTHPDHGRDVERLRETLRVAGLDRLAPRCPRKLCRRCGRVKPLTEFPRDRSARRDGLHTLCFPCHRKARRRSDKRRTLRRMRGEL